MVDDYNRPVMYKSIKHGDYLRYTFQRKWMEKPTPSFTKLETKAFQLLLPLLSTWDNEKN
ncbi:hypothetical protein SADUNF_Sadunf10G0155000 [Salix dunnii]|uniref:Uncharacterized protein n=1 Tax=Salix dunnii TaxID=1413687 RepID=A0A835MYY6_9ROSI|nr:hypothetical protein SADUNF_Sadunf10G0155000 [Salix dunnii]